MRKSMTNGMALATPGRKRKRLVFSGLTALVFLILSLIWKVAQPGYGTTVAYDWDELKGFKSVSIKRPPASGLVRALVAPMDQFVILQTKPHIPPLLRKEGLKRATGDFPIHMLGPLPIVLGIDILQLGPWKTVDPEKTALMEAADHGDLAQVNQLLANGADVNASDQRGYTALLYACRKLETNTEVIRALISAGADVNAKDKRQGATALIYATENGTNLKTVEELVNAGANVNARDDWGQYPLLNAVFTYDGDDSSAGMVKFLLAHGADLIAKNKNGETALDIARKRGKFKVVQLLRQAGANL